MRARAWMIPWLFPVGVLAVVVVVALAPTWGLGVLGAVLACGVLPMIWRVYTRQHPDRQHLELPGWLPGGRPPR